MIFIVQVYLFLALNLLVLGLSVWALVDVLRRPAAAFPWAGKRTRGFWLALTAVASAVSFLCVPPPLGAGFLSSFFALAAAVVAGVYLADVRPAVRGYRPGGRW